MDQETTFADGNVSAVVRRGNTVRRSTGPWTPAVHALLRHLEQSGFAESPRPLGIDEQGREILSFLPGDTIPAWLGDYRTDETLVEAAQLLRRYHNATASFTPPPDAAWRFSPTAPRSGDVICHNDFAPYNLVVQHGHITGLIDWDFAAPAPRVWDIAHALWRIVPLYADEQFGSPTERGRRMRLFCDSYGWTDLAIVLDTVRQRQRTAYETLRVWAEQGIPAFAKMWREGHADGVANDIAYLDQHRAELEAALFA